MTKEGYLELEAACKAEAEARGGYDEAAALRGQIAERFDIDTEVNLNIKQVTQELVLDMLDKHVAEKLAAYEEASAALQELLDGYDEKGPWDITVRLAPSLTDEVAAANNAKATVSLERNMIKIVADVEELEESTSSNPSQGTHKWIGLGIGTGLSSVTMATYNGARLTEADGEEAVLVGLDQAGEFVLYVRADELATVPKAIRLGADGYPDVALSIMVVPPEA